MFNPLAELSALDQRVLCDLAAQYPIKLTLEADAAGMPLWQLLIARLNLSPTLAQTLMVRGAIWINSVRVNEPLTEAPPEGELVVHTPPAGLYANPVVTPADILFEDEWILVLNKPAAWYSVATPWDTFGHLEGALQRFFLERDGEAVPFHLVHRLDHGTSGALIVSKNPSLNSRFQRMFNEGRVQKTYLALCSGVPDWTELEVVTGHSRGEFGLWSVYPETMIDQLYGPKDRRVRRAHTSFIVQAVGNAAALLAARLHTGRTHQIRLHAKHVGHPLVGDQRYGGVTQFGNLSIPDQLLHAAWLQFPHPRYGLMLELIAPVPSVWHTVGAAVGIALQTELLKEGHSAP